MSRVILNVTREWSQPVEVHGLRLNGEMPTCLVCLEERAHPKMGNGAFKLVVARHDAGKSGKKLSK